MADLPSVASSGDFDERRRTPRVEMLGLVHGEILRLATPVEFVKGVGPARAELLERLGLRTAAHLLFHFPRDYQDLMDRRSVLHAPPGRCGRADERG